MSTIVMLRALGLGDFLTAVPAYRALRRAFDNHELVLAAPREFTDLAGLTGAVDRVVTADRGLSTVEWQGPGPDVAVNLHGRGPQSHRLLDSLTPKRRIGFRAEGWQGPQWRDAEHEVDRWCRMLAYHGIIADPLDLILPRPSITPPALGAVVIHPGAAYGSRRWPARRFASVTAWLQSAGYDVVITGTATERGLASQVAVGGHLPESANLAGTTNLIELAALIAYARLVICGDTGVAHLATAFGTPSVVLFGPISPGWWGPRTDGPHTTLWHGAQARGDQFGQSPDPALLALSVDEVLSAASMRLHDSSRTFIDSR